jgi:hypothetical protein
MNKKEACQLARERALDVLLGDRQIGGIACFLSAKGYREEDIALVDEAYGNFIAQLEAKIGENQRQAGTEAGI